MPPMRRKAGRPPGSRNKPSLQRQPTPNARTLTGDPDKLVTSQLALVEWYQACMRLEMQRKMDTHDPRVTPEDTKRLMDMSNALVRAVVALQKVSNVAEELSKRLTPAELLEAAIKKLEGQDVKVLDYAIKRLRLAKTLVRKAAGEGAPGASAAEALAALGD